MEVATCVKIQPVELSITCMKGLRALARDLTRASKLASCKRGLYAITSFTLCKRGMKPVSSLILYYHCNIQLLFMMGNTVVSPEVERKLN
jgi:hypothetical protein